MAAEDKTLLEIARAQYAFKATVGKTLSFRQNDQFLIYHPSTKEKNWWQVVNTKGQVGYVPSNYMTAIPVSPECMGEFLNDIICKVQAQGDSELLSRLIQRRKRLNGELAFDEKAALSRTPSIISIPPVPNQGETGQQQPKQDHPPPVPKHAYQEQPPPVPKHGSQSTFTHHTLPKHTRVEPKYSQQEHIPRASTGPRQGAKETFVPPPKEELTQSPAKPAPAEKTFSVKRRVAEISNQLGEDGNTGTIKRSSSKARDQERKTPPKKEDEPKEEKVAVEVKQPEPCNVVTQRRRSSVRPADKVISDETVYQLVEDVRRYTELSYDRSRAAVAVVVGTLENLIPNNPLLLAILEIVQGPLQAPQVLVEGSHDAQRLAELFRELTSCKDDEQQRSWMLYEDEHTIIKYISELTSILTDADGAVCRHVVSSDHYSGVMTLIQYYQMETRWSIRQPLLTAFGVLCGLDRAVVSILLTSVLPCELARDMKSHPNDLARLNFSSLLLTMIFSMGEPMPVTDYEFLGVEFASFVLGLIENPPERDERLQDRLINLLLSYNLQFQDQENPLIEALSTKHTAKVFTEKILLLFNREADPVRMLDHVPAPGHSVLKLFVDLFTNSATAALFYTNDVKVLIDIIVRQLADLSPGNQRRHQYLCLCRVVMRQPGYSEHHHRKDDLLKCFTRIFCEESEASREDQKLVRDISNEFPHYFKC